MRIKVIPYFNSFMNQHENMDLWNWRIHKLWKYGALFWHLFEQKACPLDHVMIKMADFREGKRPDGVRDTAQHHCAERHAHRPVYQTGWYDYLVVCIVRGIAIAYCTSTFAYIREIVNSCKRVKTCNSRNQSTFKIWLRKTITLMIKKHNLETITSDSSYLNYLVICTRCFQFYLPWTSIQDWCVLRYTFQVWMHS